MEAGKQRPGTTGSCFMGPRLIAENHFLAIILLEQFHSRNEGHGLDNSLEQFIVINGGHGKLGDGIILSDSFMSPTEAGNQRPGTTGT